MVNQYCKPGLEAFPSLEQASEDGLLAVGGDLSPERLQCAYSLGVFPWFEEGQPILWWSPDPRCILYPEQFKTSRSLRKAVQRASFRVSYDLAFESVIAACAAPRDQHAGTWITPGMQNAYGKLHELGCAHSVEVWQGDELVGGLYGVSLGRVFYGESMFSRVSNASKFALKSLCEKLVSKNYKLIDCQLESEHLLSLGAQTIPRAQFIGEMDAALQYDEEFKTWS
ncbi:MAG: leucyl/phenylalanyl-tRNA--protein transferase [Proteobacteria bacterium]|nr:leucyl/phenylalanyl-tRNA--protein transferase [Pseudomonadota bacterium]